MLCSHRQGPCLVDLHYCTDSCGSQFSCLFLVCSLLTGHLALSLSGYLWMVLAGRRGMCAHSGYFKICQCALFFFRVLHTMFSHLRAHAFALSVTVARSSAVQASSSRRQERRWAIVCGSPQSQSTDWASSR